MQYKILKYFEICFYFLVYLIFLLYGLVNVFSIRKEIIELSNLEFASGWKLIGGLRDDTSDSHENFKSYLYQNVVWYIIHIVICELLRLYNKPLPLAHSIIGISFVIYAYKIQSILLIFAQLITSYFVTKLYSKNLNWLLAALWIAIINIIKNSSALYENLEYQEFYELIILQSWCILKCLSFGLTNISAKSDVKRYNFLNYLGYTLYFPTLVFGPFMIYDRYLNIMETDQHKNLRKRSYQFLKDIARVILWLKFTDFALHFFYVHYMEQDITAVRLLSDSFSLYGFGYLMGQFFHLYYIVTYGLGIAFSKFDTLNPPNRPKCIGRIHFYSDMWKHFDQGLYEFLFRHIYASLCQRSSSSIRKMFAIIVTFGFIYIWHGYFMQILVWTILNLACLVLEKVYKQLFQSQWYEKRIAKNLSTENQQRLYALVGTQIFLPSVISNFYFFSGIEIGNYFVNSTYRNGLLHYTHLTLCCYCIFQCSEAVWKWTQETRK